MLYEEARAIADELCPQRFKFHSLDLLRVSDDDRGSWVARFIAPERDPETSQLPVVIERFPNEYTPGDPPPAEDDATDTTDTTDTNAQENGQ